MILAERRVKRSRLLFVDDEEDLRTLVKRHLSLEGFSIETASDGDEALDFLQHERFDLVLLDIHMPRMNGVRVLEFMRDHGMRTRLIVLTGIDDPLVMQRCVTLGALDFVRKPYNFHELIDSIDRVLAN